MSELSEIMSRLNAEQTKYSTKKTKAQATRVRASLLELKKACDGAHTWRSQDYPGETKIKKACACRDRWRGATPSPYVAEGGHRKAQACQENNQEDGIEC